MTRAAPLVEELGPAPSAPPRRVVSLCPSITESLIALGLAASVVGITRYCIHPAAAVASMPKVGGTKDPDLSAIRALAPDLVLANREENRRGDVAALVQAGLAVEVSAPNHPVDVVELLAHWGRRFACPGAAQPFTREIADQLARPPLPSFRFLAPIWRRPWMAAAAGTYIDGMLTALGGRNVLAAERGAYPTLEPEEIVALPADRIILSTEPYPFEARHADELRAAGAPGQVVVVSGEDLCWHGTRTGAALERLRLALAS